MDTSVLPVGLADSDLTVGTPEHVREKVKFCVRLSAKTGLYNQRWLQYSI